MRPGIRPAARRGVRRTHRSRGLAVAARLEGQWGAGSRAGASVRREGRAKGRAAAPCSLENAARRYAADRGAASRSIARRSIAGRHTASRHTASRYTASRRTARGTRPHQRRRRPRLLTRRRRAQRLRPRRRRKDRPLQGRTFPRRPRRWLRRLASAHSMPPAAGHGCGRQRRAAAARLCSTGSSTGSSVGSSTGGKSRDSAGDSARSLKSRRRRRTAARLLWASLHNRHTPGRAGGSG